MSKTVVVVDDLEFMRMAIKDALKETPFTIVAEGENGEEAIALYREFKPDVLILDITMPVLDGLSALKAIRKEHPLSKVVMCSALSEEEYVLKAIFLGARDFIVKPFSDERLQSCLKMVTAF